MSRDKSILHFQIWQICANWSGKLIYGHFWKPQYGISKTNFRWLIG